MADQKAVVVGFDGATFDLINRLVKEGRLPAFARLVANGVRGELMSTIPPATIPAWPSFMTGKSPGQHGVFDFFKKDSEGNRRLVSSRDVDGPTLWRHLSRHGRRCIVVNVPCTYPPEPVNGIIVSGMLTPAAAEYVNPPERAADLDAWTGGYRVNPRSEYIRSPFDRDELIRELRQVTEIQKCAFVELLKQEHWDFAMLMFRATDIIQHKLWHRSEDVAKLYEFMDDKLDEIVAAADGASIWLMSDHGFGPLDKLFHVNQWLRDQGWLAIRRRDASAREGPGIPRRAGMSDRDSILRRLATRLGLSREWARSALSPQVQSLLKRILPGRSRRWVPGSAYEIDWPRTKVFNDSAFTQETQALRINLRSREPQGTVGADDYERLRDRVIQALSELRDPYTNDPVVTQVHKGDELFAGPYVDNAPDLVLELRNGYKMMSSFVSQQWISPVSPVGGCHRREGIFAAMGPDIACGLDLGRFSITDVMPTILHYLGLPRPALCDGQVQRGVFASQSEPARRTVSCQQVSSLTRLEERETAEDGDEEIISRLRALGYIE